MTARAWDSYVISLPHAVDRRARLLPRLARFGIEPIVSKAIDGELLTEIEIGKVYDPELNRRVFKRRLSRSEIGCYLSHRAIWRKIARSDSPGAFVFEDDADPTDDLPTVVDRITALDLERHLIKLDSYVPRIGRRLARLTARHSLFDPWIAPASSHAYAVSREAALCLLDTTLPFARPVDLDIKHWWERGIVVLTVFPSPLRKVVDPTRDSSIERARKRAQRGLSARQRFIGNLEYQAQFHADLNLARLRNLFAGSDRVFPSLNLRDKKTM